MSWMARGREGEGHLMSILTLCFFSLHCCTSFAQYLDLFLAATASLFYSVVSRWLGCGVSGGGMDVPGH